MAVPEEVTEPSALVVEVSALEEASTPVVEEAV